MSKIFNKLWRSLTNAEMDRAVDTAIRAGKDTGVNDVLDGIVAKVLEIATASTTYTLSKADYEEAIAGIPKGKIYYAKYKVGTAYGYGPIFMETNSNANTLNFFLDGTHKTITKGS